MAKARSAMSKSKKVAKKRPTARRTVRKSAASAPAAAIKVRPGLITHTELVSADPPSTKKWAQKVFGWKFGPTMPTPAGPYHVWRFENGTGGGIRAHHPPEVPGSIPYCEVANIRVSFDKALAAGATAMFPPEALPGDMGWIAVVSAPGGVAVGLWGLK